MEKSSILPTVTLILAFVVVLAHSAALNEKQKQSRIHKLDEDIGGNGKYIVGWVADFDTNMITFDVSVETKGFVGFGISPAGGMNGADIFVGGVSPNGAPYSGDYHGVGNNAVPDDQSDWKLIYANETETHTNLKFSRLFDTCDKEHDVAITPDTIKIIWSFGSTDELGYHGPTNRGVAQFNLLDPPMPPVDTSKYDKWTIEAKLVMPKEQTTYWCTVHKSPANYIEPRHVIGFNTLLETPESVAHTHHFTVFKCIPPAGQNHSYFEQFIGQPGDNCYAPRPLVPIEYCRTVLYIWAVGGKPLFLPENTGYQILEDTTVEYVMLDIHYNNPTNLEGVEVPTAVELFNTKTIREVNANILNVFHKINYANLIPPGQKSFKQITHCSSECTRKGLKEGVKLVNVMMHAHLISRKIKIRHFRDGTELPWIMVDNHYDFDFQQSRPLREEIDLLPGDHITVECEYDSTGRTGVSIGGYQSQEEMCQGIIWYYPRENGGIACESGYNETKLQQRFGIEGISQATEMDPPIVTAPEELAGKTFMEVVDSIDNYWTEETLAEFQREMLSEKVDRMCVPGPVTYPEFDKEYVPDDTCSLPTGPTVTTQEPTTTLKPNPSDITNGPETSSPTTPDSNAANWNMRPWNMLSSLVMSMLVYLTCLR